MISLSLTIIALALGIYLLIQIKVNNLGRLYQVLAWVLILLAAGYNMCLTVSRALFHQKIEDIVIERPYLK